MLSPVKEELIILIPDKDSKLNITRNKGGNSENKGVNYFKNVTILNIYVPNRKYLFFLRALLWRKFFPAFL
jgi:hypothetical protein